MYVIEEVAVIVIDLEVAPSRAGAHLVVDLVVDGCDALPCDIGAGDDPTDVAISGRAPLAAERGMNACGNERVQPALLDRALGAAVRAFQLERGLEEVHPPAS